MNSGPYGNDAGHTGKPRVCLPGHSGCLSCDLPTYPPPTHTQEETVLYRRKLFFADINPGLSCAAPCGILCHVYPDNHSSPLQGFSSSRVSNMKSRLREGKRDQVKRHPKGTPQKTYTSRYRRNLKRAVLCCGPHPHLRTRVWPLAVVLGESHVEKVKLGWTGEESPWGSPAKGVQWCLT